QSIPLERHELGRQIALFGDQPGAELGLGELPRGCATGRVAGHGRESYPRPSVECRAIDILMVCTGNACRSPMAAAILQQRLAERGVDARVKSAGTMPWSSGATGPAVEVMREHGLDISGHENRQMTRELVEEADLVLGMTRDHVSIAIT